MMPEGREPGSFLPDFCGSRTVFVVILVAELLAILLTLAQPLHISNRMFHLAIYSLFVQWIALSCVGVLCLCRRFLEPLNDYWTAGLSYGITLLVTLVITELAWWLQGDWPLEQGYFRYGHWPFFVKCMAISAIVCALALRYFYVQHQWRRRVESEAQARFQALQSRIRPHFLFNCMNTIASLTRRQPRAAEESIEDLADLFRVSLQDTHKISTLAEELALCKRYLRIEKHRLGERLKIDWLIDNLPLDTRLPPLILQPLLENAIYHGIEPRPEGGVICISGENNHGTLTLSIKNPVPAQSVPVQGGNQLAQENVRLRLAAFFDQAACLKVIANDHSYQVIMHLPYTHEDTNR